MSLAVEKPKRKSAPSRDTEGPSETGQPQHHVDQVLLEHIAPNPDQPRKTFNAADLEQLAESIKLHGVFQPIIVRLQPYQAAPAAGAPPYLIVAGERRWRASKLAGMEHIPAIIRRDLTDEAADAMAILENLERQDLPPVEEAAGLQALIAKHGYRQEDLAKRLGCSQAQIAKRLGLLKLPEVVRQQIDGGELSASHGVALARYKELPDFSAHLARAAVETRVASRALDAPFEALPESVHYQLQRHRAVVPIHDLSPEQEQKCKTACPFGASRKGLYGHVYCLKPSHHKELVDAANAARQAALDAMVAKAKEAGANLPDVRKMPYGSYQEISDKVPEGCSEACECRGCGITYGERIVTICTNPKQYNKLQRAANAAGKKAARSATDEILQRLQENAVEEFADQPDERALALLLYPTFREATAELRRKVASRLPESRAKTLLCESLLNDPSKTWDALADLPAGTIIYAALEVLARTEIARHLEDPRYHKLSQLHWYHARPTAAPVPEPEVPAAAIAPGGAPEKTSDNIEVFPLVTGTLLVSRESGMGAFAVPAAHIEEASVDIKTGRTTLVLVGRDGSRVETDDMAVWSTMRLALCCSCGVRTLHVGQERGWCPDCDPTPPPAAPVEPPPPYEITEGMELQSISNPDDLPYWKVIGRKGRFWVVVRNGENSDKAPWMDDQAIYMKFAPVTSEAIASTPDPDAEVRIREYEPVPDMQLRHRTTDRVAVYKGGGEEDGIVFHRIYVLATRGYMDLTEEQLKSDYEPAEWVRQAEEEAARG